MHILIKSKGMWRIKDRNHKQFLDGSINEYCSTVVGINKYSILNHLKNVQSNN